MGFVSDLGLLWLDEGGEEAHSDLRDGLLVGHGDALVQGLGTGNAVLLAVHHEPAKARVVLVLCVPLRQEVCLVDLHLAGNVSPALQRLDL